MCTLHTHTLIITGYAQPPHTSLTPPPPQVPRSVFLCAQPAAYPMSPRPCPRPPHPPGPQECISLSLARSFPMTLHPRLLAAAHTHLLGPYHLAWLDGKLEAVEGSQTQQPPQQQQQQQFGEDQEMAEADQQQSPQQQQSQDQHSSAPKDHHQQQQQQPGQQPHGPPLLQLVPGQVDASALAAAMEQGGAEAAAALVEASVGGDHGGIFIGDVKLSEVKQALAKAGISSAFRAGKLLCAGAVVVSRGAGGDEGVLEIEGPLSDDYFRM